MQNARLNPKCTSISNIKRYANHIIHLRTLPHQIDYVSPSDRKKEDQGLELIHNLPKNKRSLWLQYIERKVDAYYTPDEESGLSPADYDSLF